MKKYRKEIPTKQDDEEIKDFKELISTINVPTNQKPLNFHLVVKSPFRHLKRGDFIYLEDEINAVLACHEKHMVVKVNHEEY